MIYIYNIKLYQERFLQNPPERYLSSPTKPSMALSQANIAEESWLNSALPRVAT